MDRPNLKSATKAVVSYIEKLERDLASTKAALDSLTEGITEEEHWAGRVVGFVDGPEISKSLPMSRQMQRFYFAPEGLGGPRISLRWEDREGGYLDINVETRGRAFLIQPWAANAMRIHLKES